MLYICKYCIHTGERPKKFPNNKYLETYKVLKPPQRPTGFFKQHQKETYKDYEATPKKTYKVFETLQVWSTLGEQVAL